MNIKPISFGHISLSLVLVSLFLCPLPSQAENYATVIKVENMIIYRTGQKLVVGANISTQANQRLALRTDDGDVIALGENSQITIQKASFFKQLFGRIYYLFKPRNEKQENIQVQTVTATIGIRGTNFLVTSTAEDQSDVISLENGLLNVASPDDQPFKVHQQKPLSEFEQYQQEVEKAVTAIDQEFEDFKKQVDQEFVEYKLAVGLSAGQTLKIVGRDLFTVDLPEGQQDEIDAFKDFIADVVQ
ncbi:FecR domain-containing protein [Gammaproteobacteria bacterium]|nr:FecR domain-containing protein [Gammaproteobacteria bacterium]